MCFSAEASFTAATAIGALGVVAIRKSTNIPQKIFAVIPLFFSIQQFIEGFLWIVLENPEFLQWKKPLIYGFLFFAWLIWPVYVPFSMAMLEPNKTRKTFLWFFFGIGVFVFLCFLYLMIFHRVDANAARLHIEYTYDFTPPLPWLYGILYLIATVASMLISGVSKMWILGLVNFTSYLFSRVFFFDHIISVWCFFAAVASGLVLWYVVRMNKSCVEHNNYRIEELA